MLLPPGKDEWQMPYPSGTENWQIPPPYPGGTLGDSLDTSIKAELYLFLHSEVLIDLNWFGNEGMFEVSTGADGVPFGKDKPL